MKTLRILVIVFISLLQSTALADSTFNDLFDANLKQFNDIANRITSYHADELNLTTNEKEIELQALSVNLDAIIRTAENNPVYWFMKGLNESNLASLHNSTGHKEISLKHIAAKNTAYQRAMDLDKIHTPHLTSSMYATMKHGLPENLKIDAIQAELGLGGNAENESYYWHLHWSNVNALQQAGRYHEARQALEKMKQELKAAELVSTDYEKMVNRAQSDIDQAQQASNRNRTSPAPTPIPKQTDSSSNKDNDSDSSDIYIIIWIVIVLAFSATLIVTIIEKFVRNKK